jgi:hypothetical protein
MRALQVILVLCAKRFCCSLACGDDAFRTSVRFCRFCRWRFRGILPAALRCADQCGPAAGRKSGPDNFWIPRGGLLLSAGILPSGVGFIAATSMNCDGNVIVPAAREIVTMPSSGAAGASSPVHAALELRQSIEKQNAVDARCDISPGVGSMSPPEQTRVARRVVRRRGTDRCVTSACPAFQQSPRCCESSSSPALQSNVTAAAEWSRAASLSMALCPRPAGRSKARCGSPAAATSNARASRISRPSTFGEIAIVVELDVQTSLAVIHLQRRDADGAFQKLRRLAEILSRMDDLQAGHHGGFRRIFQPARDMPVLRIGLGA